MILQLELFLHFSVSDKHYHLTKFKGITRKYDQERIVQALKYECYLKMTYLEMEKIIKNSYQLWPSLVHIIVLHRYG